VYLPDDSKVVHRMEQGTEIIAKLQAFAKGSSEREHLLAIPALLN
jgi:hypothetical protein